MMTLEQLEAKHRELGEEIARMKAAQDDVWPKHGDRYWIIGWDGEILTECWENTSVDQGALAIGNIFRTGAQAQKEREAQRVVAEIRRQPGARGFIEDADNWVVSPSAGTERWVNSPYSFASTYFDTEEQAYNAIEAVGRNRILAAVQWWNVESWEK